MGLFSPTAWSGSCEAAGAEVNGVQLPHVPLDLGYKTELGIRHEGVEGTLSLEKILRWAAQSPPTRDSVETQEAPQRGPTSAHALCQHEQHREKTARERAGECGRAHAHQDCCLANCFLCLRPSLQPSLWLVPVGPRPVTTP